MKKIIIVIATLLISSNTFASTLHHSDQIGPTLYFKKDYRSNIEITSLFLICTSQYKAIEDCSSFSYIFRVINDYKDGKGKMISFEKSGDIPLTDLNELKREMKEYVELNKEKRDHSYEVKELEDAYKDTYKYGRGNKETFFGKLMFTIMKHPTIYIDRLREAPKREFEEKLESEYMQILSDKEFRGSIIELSDFEGDVSPILFMYSSLDDYSKGNL